MAEAKLTHEFANGVKLPCIYHPYERHEVVRAILDDPSMVGEGNEVVFHPGRQINLNVEGMFRGCTATIMPLLGRNALRGVAELLHG